MVMRMGQTVATTIGSIKTTWRTDTMMTILTTTMMIITAVLLRMCEMTIVIWTSDCMSIAGVPLKVSLPTPPPWPYAVCRMLSLILFVLALLQSTCLKRLGCTFTLVERGQINILLIASFLLVV